MIVAAQRAAYAPCVRLRSPPALMRVLTWNCRRASARHPLWAHLLTLAPDIALLQEVGALPADVLATYSVRSEHPPTRRGTPQRFTTALLVRGHIGTRLVLRSAIPWVDAQLAHFAPNLLALEVQPDHGQPVVAVSTYSPAWPVTHQAYEGQDVTEVKLPENPEIWVSDLLVPALRSMLSQSSLPWIIAGDFNACETFDRWKGGLRGNARWLGRMADLGLVECLRTRTGRLTPTFRRPGHEAPSCQIDHLFTSSSLAADLCECATGDAREVFEGNLSDHLPIVATFRN